MITAPLMIVDVQNGFVNDNSRHVIPVIRKLADRWRQEGGRIYMSQFTNYPGSQWERLIGWRRLQSEEEIAIHRDLKEFLPDAVVYKKRSYSCLVDPFRADLETHPWTDVVLCGIATDGCVLTTAVDLFEFAGRPIRPLVVRDACASHAGDEISDAGFRLIERFIGRNQVIFSSDLLNGTI